MDVSPTSNTAVHARVKPPSVEQRVDVCFLNEFNDELWWRGVVTEVGDVVDDPADINTCHGKILFYEDNGIEEHESDVVFRKDGLLGVSDEGTNTLSKWVTVPRRRKRRVRSRSRSGHTHAGRVKYKRLSLLP